MCLNSSKFFLSKMFSLARLEIWISSSTLNFGTSLISGNASHPQYGRSTSLIFPQSSLASFMAFSTRILLHPASRFSRCSRRIADDLEFGNISPQRHGTPAIRNMTGHSSRCPQLLPGPHLRPSQLRILFTRLLDSLDVLRRLADALELGTIFRKMFLLAWLFFSILPLALTSRLGSPQRRQAPPHFLVRASG